MLEENEKTIKDAKQNEAYLACGFLEDSYDAKGEEESKRVRSKEIRSRHFVGVSFQTVTIQR
eukprot:10003673-Ditylum_brightwellii.AAC.1